MSYNSRIPHQIKKPTSTGCKRLDEAINAVHEKTEVPIEMIILAFLSVIAASTQARNLLKMPRGTLSRLSLYALAIAGTGMRKTSLIDAVVETVSDFENRQKVINKSGKNAHKADRKINRKLSDNLTKRIAGLMEAGQDVSIPRNELIEIEENLAIKHPKLAFVMPNPTPKALSLILSEGLKSGFLLNGDASQLMKSARFANFTPTLNEIWSGSDPSTITPDDGKIDLSDSNLSAFLAIQDAEFLKFIDKRGEQLEGNGFIQRALVCWPGNNIGFRDKTETQSNSDGMHGFNARLTELLNDNLLNLAKNPPEKKIVEFSAEAADYFKEYSKEHEYELRPGHRFAKEAHLITKMPENIARVSANLHIFEYGEGKISLDTLKSAIELCSFYYSELCRILISPPVHETDANDFDNLFTRRIRNSGIRYAAVKAFRSSLPEKARKDPRFANAMLHLHDTGRIAKLNYCGNEYVDLYPDHPFDHIRFEYELGWIRNNNGKVQHLVTKFPTMQMLAQVHHLLQSPQLLGVPPGRSPMFHHQSDAFGIGVKTPSSL